ncbi:MAG: sigma-70 family RNA polymerase sigma factor [bacterium]|nr:sigma-70 family RNA polymerase sigma factor [bacterium]
MTPQHQIAAELVSHAGALRALARDLVGPTDAPDLVQETALRALRSPPERPHGLGAWLRAVLRNLAGNHRRTAARRQQRETAIAHEVSMAAAPAPDDLLHRHESVRLVTEALWRLPETFRSTLLRRYFEELTPKQIAEREGVPVATVKSRLQRGLAQLRADCDREDGGQWRALLPLVLRRPETPTAAAGTAVFIMTQTTKVLAVAAAIVAVAGFALFYESEQPEPATREVAQMPDPAVGATAARVGSASVQPIDSASDRVDPAAAFQAALAHPFEMSVLCRVVDRDGLPVEGARVGFGPAGGVVNLWPSGAAADGVVLLHWRARRRTMRIDLGLMFGGDGQSLRTIDVEADRVREITLLVARGGGGATCGATLPHDLVNCSTCHRGSVQPNVFRTSLVMSEGLHPFSRLREAMLIETGEIEEADAEPPPPPPIVGFAFGETDAGNLGRIEGKVYDDRGEPVAGATVIWGREQDLPLGRTRTRADGSYVLKEVATGQARVRAGGGSSGIGRATVAVGVGRTTTQDVHLARGRGMTGRVLLPTDGKNSAEGWRVEFEAKDGSWADSVDVRKDATFEFANVPAVPGRLLLWSRQSHPLPVAVQGVTEVGRLDVIFDLVATGMPGSALRGRAGIVPENRVAVWQVATGRGTVLNTSPDGTFAIPGLAPGEYRILVTSPTAGTLDLGPRWIDGLTEVDLGELTFREPARVQLGWPREGGDGLGRVECYRFGEDVDVRHSTRLTLGRGLELAAGKWFLLWEERGAVRMRRFETLAGESIEVPLVREPR